MNFPGLDPSWILSHRALYRGGLIQPWNLERCREETQKNAGILVVAPTALGDTVLCTPLLRTLAENLGRERSGFLVKENCRELYETDPHVGNLFTVSGKYRGWLDLRRQILRRNYRIALIANTTEPDLIPWLWHCGIRGFLRYRSRWSPWADWFANRDMMRRPEGSGYATGHAIDNTLAMAEALQLVIKDRQLRLTLPDAQTPAREPVILIHPGASRPRKRWPLDRWIFVARTLLDQRPEARVIVTGSKTEAADAGLLVDALGPRALNRAGQWGLRDLLLEQSKALIFLSGDTGPYHMAVAVNCPTVTLFAPTDRGSSTEACGPKYANPTRHATLEIASFDQDISSLSADSVCHTARTILGG